LPVIPSGQCPVYPIESSLTCVAKPCSTCAHPKRVEIDKALVTGEPVFALAKRYGLARSSLQRHKDHHLSGVLVAMGEAVEATQQYHEVRERASALNIAATLGTILERAQLLSDACDEWLRDPLDPSKYNVGPRSEEITVVYETWEDCGEDAKRPRLERRSLRWLLQKVDEKLGTTVVGAITRHADIRELVLKAQAGSIQAIETVAGLLERAWELQSKLDEAAKIREMSEAEVRAGLREMLREQCGLSERATDAFMAQVERGARERAVAEMREQLEGEGDDRGTTREIPGADASELD
jgi:hypothetical protein